MPDIREHLHEQVFDQTLAAFLHPVSALLADASVSEILINGPRQIYCERHGQLHRVAAQYESNEELESLCQNLAQYVQKSFSRTAPVLEARLPDGSRVTAIGPPAARHGIQLSIRRFARTRLSPGQLVEWQGATPEALEFLRLCLLGKRNVVIAGGTGSGKTTLLNILSSYFPDDDRVVVMEDVSELQIQKEHVVYLETRAGDARGRGQVTMRELLRAVLRMRPDRILMGEVRGEEALELVAALTTGHGGALTTLHADYAVDVLYRLETMCLMSDVHLSTVALRSQILSAVDVIVQQSRLRDGSRRIVGIYEAIDLDEQGGYRVRPLFLFRYQTGESNSGQVCGRLEPTGELPSFAAELRSRGYALPAAMTGKNSAIG